MGRGNEREAEPRRFSESHEISEHLGYNESMVAKTIQIRDVPESIYEKLKQIAYHEHRSLSQQGLLAVELGIAFFEAQRERRRNLLSQWHETVPLKWSDSLPEPNEAIRGGKVR